jgi:hypothetical protein
MNGDLRIYGISLRLRGAKRRKRVRSAFTGFAASMDLLTRLQVKREHENALPILSFDRMDKNFRQIKAWIYTPTALDKPTVKEQLPLTSSFQTLLPHLIFTPCSLLCISLSPLPSLS